MSTPDGSAWLPDAPPSIDRFFAPDLQPYPVLPVIGLVLAAVYAAGWLRLRLAARPWPAWRGIVFLLGCAVVVVVMGAGIEGYGHRLFSVFMFQQLTLMMAVPPLLVLGSPGTLLLRATPHRGPGRLVLHAALGALRSRTARVLLHPGFMIPLFLLAFYGLYLSDLATNLLASWAGHVGLELAFLAAGILFTVPLISADPLPIRQTHLGRFTDLFVEMPLHAFFGVIVMMSVTPLVPVFADPPADWGIDPIQDQQLAGALAWSYGEAPALIIALVLMARWFADDTRNAAARDRQVDALGDAEREAYNAYLERLSRSDVEKRDDRTA